VAVLRLRKPAGIDNPITIRWHAELLGRLCEQLLKESNAEERPRERGGLLLGTVQQTENWVQVTPRLFMPIPCSYREGPRYHLSEGDQFGMRRSMALVSPYWVCLGLYRGHCRPGLELDDRDKQLARKHLKNPFSIFLLVNTVASDGPRGGIFLFNGGEFSASPALFELPLGVAGELGPARAGDLVVKGMVELSIPLPPRPKPVRNRVSSAVAKFFSAFRGKWTREWLVCGLILAVIGMVAVLSRGAWHAQKSSEASRHAASLQSSLDLTTSVERDHLLISWNPQSPAVASATSGSLAITDGAAHKTIPLDKEVLAHGSAVYYPTSDVATVELRIGDLAESLVAAGLGTVTQAAKSAEATRKSSGARKKDSPKWTAPGGAYPLDLRRFSTLAKDSGSEPIRAKYAPPPSPRPSVASPEVIQPPDPGIAGNASGSAAVRLPVGQPLAPVNLPLTPPAPAGRSGPAEAVPFQRVDFAAARPIKRVSPRAYGNALRVLASKVTIRVQVHISAEGKVVRVDALSRGNTLVEYLSRVSASAAREWVFTPARRDGRDVDSIETLEFVFDRSGIVQSP